ncbi:MAG: DUF465 domain-containing protein [Nitrospirota bacterium]
MLVEDPVFLEKLRKENREFADLEKEHKKLDDELNILLKRRVLTAEEEVLKRRLQKEKLAKKDRMAEIYREGKKIKD